MNSVIEATNKNIKKIMQKMVVTYKDWHEMLSFALHVYHITIRTSTRLHIIISLQDGSSNVIRSRNLIYKGTNGNNT